jgi:signal transduction histidine kinase
MTGIIRELLDFSRRRGTHRETTNLREVVDQAMTLLEPIAETRDVEVDASGVGDLDAAIDVNKTLQVLTNLMMNAVQAMPRGGTVRIAARSEHIDEPVNDHAEAGEFIAVSISDDGVGIPEEARKHIFQPFFTTKRPGRGTGLGLYVCHGIVSEQSGWIDVESAEGEGSTFTVYLPRHADGEDA